MMSFLFTSFLITLAAVAIPVIIHLFNFRRYRRVLFPNIRFLVEITKKTQSQSRLRHLFVLCCRILAMAMIVLAFAQPFIPSGNTRISEGEKVVGIYTDNSFSMEQTDEETRLLDMASGEGRKIISAYRSNDKFVFTTNDFTVSQQRLAEKEEISDWMSETAVSPNNRTLSQIIARQSEIMSSGSNSGLTVKNDKTTPAKITYIISDFQKTFSDFGKLHPDSTHLIRLVPLAPEAMKNIFIDSCWFYSPVHQVGKPEKLFVRLRNISPDDYEEFSVKVYINSKQKALSSANLPSNSSVTVPLSFTVTEPGIQHGKAVISDSQVAYDNTFYFSYEISSNIRILAIHEDSSNIYLNALFGKSDFATLTNTTFTNLSYSDIPSYNLIILDGLRIFSSGLSETLKKFMVNGGSIVLFPHSQPDIDSYNAFFSQSGMLNPFLVADTNATKVSYMNTEHEIFSDIFEKIPENIDLPSVRFHFTSDFPSKSFMEVLLKLQNSDVFLSKYNIGRGKIYICASPIGDKYSSFPRHALFVPMMLKIALFSIQSQALYYIIGKTAGIETNSSLLMPDHPFHVISYSADSVRQGRVTDVIPELVNNETGSILYLHDQINYAGNYSVASGTKIIRGVAFNYDRAESYPDYYSANELKEKCSEYGLDNIHVEETKNMTIASAVREMDAGRTLWKLCIAAALFFVALEVILLRFFK